MYEIRNPGIQCIITQIAPSCVVICLYQRYSEYIYIYRYTIYTFVPLKERKTFRKDNQIILEFRFKTPQLDSLHFSATVRMFALSAWYRRGLSFDPRSLRVRFQECFFLFFTSCPGPKQRKLEYSHPRKDNMFLGADR